MRPRLTLTILRRTLPHLYALAAAFAFTGFAAVNVAPWGT